ncbi:hypothetical protein GCM10007895_15750 [Paraferrimonas sedimenticola]|uniref:Lipoprotein n=2 Tax=Paraferrimonas sedimenticola TaxID=375674 RepID=A0AA37RWJ9_9GAMM|nr:hypothetical protein GCM10007895_15750 [Paraferrimonas sedimenticola]
MLKKLFIVTVLSCALLGCKSDEPSTGSNTNYQWHNDLNFELGCSENHYSSETKDSNIPGVIHYTYFETELEKDVLNACDNSEFSNVYSIIDFREAEVEDGVLKEVSELLDFGTFEWVYEIGRDNDTVFQMNYILTDYLADNTIVVGIPYSIINPGVSFTDLEDGEIFNILIKHKYGSSTFDVQLLKYRKDSNDFSESDIIELTMGPDDNPQQLLPWTLGEIVSTRRSKEYIEKLIEVSKPSTN